MNSPYRMGTSAIGCVVSAPFLCLLVLVIAGCAAASSRGSADRPKGKARGPEVIVLAGDRTHYFENRLPHCLAYSLTGEWDFAAQQAALRTPDGRRFVGVALHHADAIPGPSGGDPVSRAVAYIIGDAEKDWGRLVPSKVQPFPASRSGAVLLQFEEVVVTPEAAGRTIGPGRPPVGQTARLPLRVIASFGSGLVLVVTVVDVNDALEVFKTLEVTEDPQCWRRAIRERFPALLR